jgi:hypothetical protein
MTLRIISSCCPCSCHNSLLITNGNKEMKFLLVAFQNTKDDLVPYLSDDFQSYLEMFDEYPTEHLDPTYEDDCQPPLCSDFDTSKDIVCLKKVTHDFSSQPPAITLPCFPLEV